MSSSMINLMSGSTRSAATMLLKLNRISNTSSTAVAKYSSGGPINTAGTNDNVKSSSNGAIKKSVFISQSYDVFTNLALEDWIYKNYNFEKHHVLMLWANDPCVVIGRHQNPFSEANVSQLMANGVTMVRRNSGGGAVFHDRGNLNCTFFSSRDRYNRDYNLNIITRALFREWGINAEISPRDDITLMGKKVCFYRTYHYIMKRMLRIDSKLVASNFNGPLILSGFYFLHSTV